MERELWFCLIKQHFLTDNIKAVENTSLFEVGSYHLEMHDGLSFSIHRLSEDNISHQAGWKVIEQCAAMAPEDVLQSWHTQLFSLANAGVKVHESVLFVVASKRSCCSIISSLLTLQDDQSRHEGRDRDKDKPGMQHAYLSRLLV